MIEDIKWEEITVRGGIVGTGALKGREPDRVFSRLMVMVDGSWEEVRTEEKEASDIDSIC